MSQAKIIFERPAEVEFAPVMTRALPKTLRKAEQLGANPCSFTWMSNL